MYSDLFQSQAASYREYRPVYPTSVANAIEEYNSAGPHKSSQLAVDIATGSGQVAAEFLAPQFERVLGLDISEQQILHAMQAPNVEYRVGTAETTGIADHSVDLATSAEAFHYFDHAAFYAEMHRILKPHATLVVWGYEAGHLGPADTSLEGSEPYIKANELLRELDGGTLGSYWSDRRSLVDNHYVGLEPPEHLYEEVCRNDELIMQKEMPVRAFIGYLSSWSGYATFKKQHPDQPDPLEQFQQQLLQVLQITENDNIVAKWPLFMMFARAKDLNA